MIGAVVKVVDSHLCGWCSIPGNSCSFLIVSLSKGLSLCFKCSDQHVKYPMPLGFPLTNSLLLDYHVKQYTIDLIILLLLSLCNTHTKYCPCECFMTSMIDIWLANNCHILAMWLSYNQCIIYYDCHMSSA